MLAGQLARRCRTFAVHAIRRLMRVVRDGSHTTWFLGLLLLLLVACLMLCAW
jgi:hypothetical protein